MTTPYVDPQTVHNPSTGTVPPASWGKTVRDDLEFLAKTPGCVLQCITNLSLGNGAWGNLAWTGTDLRDTDGYHAANSDQIVIPAGLGGWYNISGSVTAGVGTGGNRAVRYTLNGSGDNRMAVVSPAPTLGTRIPFSQDVYLVPNDVLRISVYQNSGGTLSVGDGSLLSVRLVALA